MIPTDPDALAEYKRKNKREKCILLDAVKDYLIHHVTGKKNAFDMLVAFMKLYQSNNQNWKMIFREKLRYTKMTKTDNVT